MRIRMLQTVTGTFHNVDAGVVRGDIVDVDEFNALRYIKNGIAEAINDQTEESAVLTPQVETATLRRRTRPKKKPAEWHDEGAPGWSEGNPQS